MEPLHDTHSSKALQAFSNAGGVVEHFLFRNPQAAESDLHPHRLVAQASLKALQERYPGGRNQFGMQVDGECFAQATPFSIAPDTFLSSKSQKLFDLRGDQTTYPYAVLHPPYNLRGTEPEQLALLERLCRALFGDLETLEIYEWPTDCSNYFDAGKEWWGTFFWTVYSPTYDWYICILASTTD